MSSKTSPVLRVYVNKNYDPKFHRRIMWTACWIKIHQIRDHCCNNHYWAQDNPHIIRENNNWHRFNFNVSCSILGNRVAYQIYDEHLNGVRYLEILRSIVNHFLNALPILDRFNIWYQLELKIGKWFWESVDWPRWTLELATQFTGFDTFRLILFTQYLYKLDRNGWTVFIMFLQV